jgi:hypothetical protein
MFIEVAKLFVEHFSIASQSRSVDMAGDNLRGVRVVFVRYDRAKTVKSYGMAIRLSASSRSAPFS